MTHSRLVRAGIASLLCSSAFVATAMARAQPMAAPPPAPPPPTKVVEGHIGVATPLVTVASKTTTIADQFTLLNPIGIGFKPSDHVVLDFETTVATTFPDKVNVLVVDPGVVYDWGPVATGIRIAFKTNQMANVGLIPLVNRGLVDLGGATWFIEAAFPTFYQDHKGEFNVVLHTGLGF